MFKMLVSTSFFTYLLSCIHPDNDAAVTASIGQPVMSLQNQGQVYTGGVATYFLQYGAAGACGKVHKDTDLIAAMDQARYNSKLCGKEVKITNTKNKKTVTVTVADDCPGCKNENSIDLSKGAFLKIATIEEGEVPISWEYV